MITLSAPTRDIQIALAIAWATSDAPGKVAIAALALCVSWPSPPWEAAARSDLELARQNEREARQWVEVAPADQKAAARQGHFQARQKLEAAESALSTAAFDLHDIPAAAKVALARLDAAGVPVSAWLSAGNQLLSSWVEALSPAPEEKVQEVWSFTLPPPDRTSAGGSNSPTGTPGTPSAG